MKRLIKCQKITKASNQSGSDWENMLITSHLTWAHTAPCNSPPALVTGVLYNECLWLTDAEEIIVLFAFFFYQICLCWCSRYSPDILLKPIYRKGKMSSTKFTCRNMIAENCRPICKVYKVLQETSKSKNKDKLHSSTSHFSYFSNLNTKLSQQ